MAKPTIQYDQESLTERIGNLLDLVGSGSLSFLCELPYVLIDRAANLFNLNTYIYYDKKGERRYRPSRVQRYLQSRLVECHKRDAAYFSRCGDNENYGVALGSARFTERNVKGFDEAIRNSK